MGKLTSTEVEKLGLTWLNSLNQLNPDDFNNSISVLVEEILDRYVTRGKARQIKRLLGYYPEETSTKTGEPLYTDEIKQDLFRQKDEGTLANPTLWDEIEDIFSASHYRPTECKLATAHAYWYEEILNSNQRKAYPFEENII